MPQLNDLTGKKFGRITVICRAEKPGEDNTYWLCKCDCEDKTEWVVNGTSLQSGGTMSCGCLLREKTRDRNIRDNPQKINDLTGLKFGTLTVKEYSRNFKNAAYWICICDCTREEEIRGAYLTAGRIVKCSVCTKENRYAGKYLGENVAAMNALFRDYLKSAERREIPFSLSFDYFKEIVNRNCYYCGVEPKQIQKTHRDNLLYNGIDRLDSMVGYELDNVVACCWTCNHRKGTDNEKEFLDWIKRVYENIIVAT